MGGPAVLSESLSELNLWGWFVGNKRKASADARA